MNLVLWRHAQAVELADAGGDDLARGLTSRGQRQAADVGAWLQQRLPSDAIVLTSPALRAVQTACALPREHRVIDAMAPDRGSVDWLLEAAGWKAPGAATAERTVVFVGHQPVLGMTAARLLCGQPQTWTVRKGAAWWLRSHTRSDACELWMVRSPTV